MILVHLSKKVDKYPQGEYAVPTDHDWLSILDDDGLTLAMYPREKIVRVEIVKEIQEVICAGCNEPIRIARSMPVSPGSNIFVHYMTGCMDKWNAKVKAGEKNVDTTR